MAGINLGGGGRSRAVNQEINMIPFIDLLLVTVAFLLITAVWTTYARVNVNAQVPGAQHGTDYKTPSKDLHVYAKDAEFVLTWKQGSTVISETRIERKALGSASAPEYDDLAAKIKEEWAAHGSHKDASDKELDRCVFHSDNDEPFREIVAMMDAVYEAKRDIVLDGRRRKVSAFNMAFASR